MTVVVGVDPGSRTTAVVAVELPSRDPLEMVLVRNEGELLPMPPGYLADVVAQVRGVVDRHGGGVVRVEGVNRPSWHVGGRGGGSASNPTGLLGTAMVFGAVVAAVEAWDGVEVEVIAPSRNGSRPLGVYPEVLVGPGERRGVWQTRTGTGKLRHARSAYDVALGGILGIGRLATGR